MRLGSLVLLFSFAIALLCAPSSEAARTAGKKQRTSMLRAAAASDSGNRIRLRVNRGGRATMEPLGYRGRAKVLAVRSSLDPRWGLLITTLSTRADQRMTFLLRREAGRWRVRAAATRGSESAAICRLKRPGTAVTLDLGLSTDGWVRRCRHRRDRKRLVRAMTAAEVSSVRAMVEWRFSDATGALEPGPVQPAVSDVRASDCSWAGRGALVPPPGGDVARSDPRWGLLTVTCGIGSDGFAIIDSPTVLLVGRTGRSGPFTRAAAHTLPVWSMRGSLCDTDRRWPVPAAPRVALGFCSAFPAAIRNALR